MAAGQHPVCKCAEPCACYARGFTDGAQLAESGITSADPAEHSPTGMSREAAIDDIQAAARCAIRQAMGEDYGSDAEEDSQCMGRLVAQFLLERLDGSEISVAYVASLVAHSDLCRDKFRPGVDSGQTRPGRAVVRNNYWVARVICRCAYSHILRKPPMADTNRPVFDCPALAIPRVMLLVRTRPTSRWRWPCRTTPMHWRLQLPALPSSSAPSLRRKLVASSSLVLEGHDNRD